MRSLSKALLARSQNARSAQLETWVIAPTQTPRFADLKLRYLRAMDTVTIDRYASSSRAVGIAPLLEVSSEANALLQGTEVRVGSVQLRVICTI